VAEFFEDSIVGASSVIKPGKITIATAIDVVQPRLDQQIPVVRAKHGIEALTVLRIRKDRERLPAEFREINVLKLGRLNDVFRIKLGANTIAEIAAVGCIAPAHQQRQSETTCNDTPTHRTLPHVPHKFLAIRKRECGGKSKRNCRLAHDGIRPVVTSTSEVDRKS